MRVAELTVHGELVDHLGADQVDVRFELPAGLRDLVQSTGIPHVEIARALVDATSQAWSATVDDGASIEVWPRYPLEDPESDPRFVLDVHLGKLARHLRLLGVDAGDAPDIDDAALATAAGPSGRILLSRDRRLLMRRVIERGRWIRATDPIEQAAEVVAAFCLADVLHPFTRCIECNGELYPADPATIDVPDRVRQRHAEFTQCRDCFRAYWRGTHHARLEATVTRILAVAERRHD